MTHILLYVSIKLGQTLLQPCQYHARTHGPTGARTHTAHFSLLFPRSDEDYTNAEALILTFSLNNYNRDDPRFNVALEWEQIFLNIVQEYQQDPSNNFTFAYMAEV